CCWLASTCWRLVCWAKCRCGTIMSLLAARPIQLTACFAPKAKSTAFRSRTHLINVLVGPLLVKCRFFHQLCDFQTNRSNRNDQTALVSCRSGRYGRECLARTIPTELRSTAHSARRSHVNVF